MSGNTIQILIAMIIYMAAVILIGVFYAKRANKIRRNISLAAVRSVLGSRQ